MKNKTAVCLLALLLCMMMLLSSCKAKTPEEMLEGMTLEEKISQMMMVEFTRWDMDGEGPEESAYVTSMNDQVKEAIASYGFGGILLFSENIGTTEETYGLVEEMQDAAKKNIPVLIATDQEGGSVFRLKEGTALPGNMAVAATGNEEYAYEAGKIIGSELASVGVNTALAPVVDVASNAANPVIGLRSFSDDEKMCTSFASKMIEGIREEGCVSCTKHFPGHGDTDQDSHYGLPMVEKSYEALKECELVPFQKAIESGTDMIMTAHILYPEIEKDKVLSQKTGKEEALPATMSDDILTDILKDDMRFSGVVVTDAMNMGGISDFWNPEEAVILSIKAGADMICMPVELKSRDSLEEYDQIISSVVKAVEKKELSEERIDDAVLRILKIKEERGILSDAGKDASLDKAKDTVGSKEHRDMEEKMALDAVTMVRNANGTLPLAIDAHTKVCMLTPFDNETAQMAMGLNKAVEDGIKIDKDNVIIEAYYEKDENKIKEDIAKSDIVIIQSESASLKEMSDNPVRLYEYARSLGKKVIIVSVSRPYDVQLYKEADAVLAVYGCSGMEGDPTEVLISGDTGSEKAIGPNIAAGIRALFLKELPKGSLPVDIPVFDQSTKEYTDSIYLQRGYAVR